jgi:hypothetical protein
MGNARAQVKAARKKFPCIARKANVRLAAEDLTVQGPNGGDGTCYETTRQPLLFLDSCADPKAPQTPVGSISESSVPAASTEGADGPQLGDPSPSRTVSPVADMCLNETCGFCGRIVRLPGYVIPDYDELGAFCNQDCADRRFRMYLQEASE